MAIKSLYAKSIGTMKSGKPKTSGIGTDNLIIIELTNLDIDGDIQKIGDIKGTVSDGITSWVWEPINGKRIVLGVGIEADPETEDEKATATLLKVNKDLRMAMETMNKYKDLVLQSSEGKENING